MPPRHLLDVERSASKIRHCKRETLLPFLVLHLRRMGLPLCHISFAAFTVLDERSHHASRRPGDLDRPPLDGTSEAPPWHVRVAAVASIEAVESSCGDCSVHRVDFFVRRAMGSSHVYGSRPAQSTRCTTFFCHRLWWRSRLLCRSSAVSPEVQCLTIRADGSGRHNPQRSDQQQTVVTDGFRVVSRKPEHRRLLHEMLVMRRCRLCRT